MRVLILSQYFWPESFRINEIAQALSAKGVFVEVLTGKPNYPAGKIFEGYRAFGCSQDIEQSLLVHRVPLLPRGKGALGLFLNYLSFILFGILFAPWLLRRKKFDAIFVFAPSPILQAIPAIWLSRLKKTPVLLWVQDLWPESLSATGYVTNQRVLRMVGSVVGWIYRNVDLILAQSRNFIPRIRQNSGSTEISYLPNPFLETEQTDKQHTYSCPDLECEFPILFAGNIGTAQAVETILEAADFLKERPEIRIVMMGAGSKRDWMMEEAKKRGLTNIVFPGSFPVETMPVLMTKAAALLVTLADAEIYNLTIPSKIQAYLAAGRPIIACLNGAGAEVIEEAKAGMTCAAEDATALAERIKTLHSLPLQKRVKLGENGRRFYEEQFSQEKLVNDLMEHFSRVIQKHGKGQSS
ncbi:MAG: glycosyltransferase family 4 protein [Rhodobacteraceae bacterium]|nr:glycosyltransferase family 4 protein [Paracoccaceae bacterium]